MNSRILGGYCLRQLARSSFLRKAIPCHVRLISAIPVARDSRDILIPKTLTHNLQTYRYKSKKKGKKAQQDDDDDDEKEEEDDEEGTEGTTMPGEKILKLSQIRTDKLMKVAMNNSRIVDDAILEGRLRKNDDKVIKKAAPFVEGDIIDIELGADPKNPDFLQVHRVEVLEIKEGVHSMVRVLISKKLSIKPYD